MHSLTAGISSTYHNSTEYHVRR